MPRPYELAGASGIFRGVMTPPKTSPTAAGYDLIAAAYAEHLYRERFLHEKYAAVPAAIGTTGAMSDDIQKQLIEAIEAFNRTF